MNAINHKKWAEDTFIMHEQADKRLKLELDALRLKIDKV